MSTTAEFPFVLPQAPPAQQDEPTWEIAFLYPTQGNWTEEDYLALDTNWLVELSDGFLEVLPMPTPYHQLLVDRLHKLVQQHVEPRDLGRAFFAPPIRLWPRKFREPDVMFIRKEKLADLREQPEGADLVMEVVSEGEESRQRDLVTKREEYAKDRRSRTDADHRACSRWRHVRCAWRLQRRADRRVRTPAGIDGGCR